MLLFVLYFHIVFLWYTEICFYKIDPSKIHVSSQYGRVSHSGPVNKDNNQSENENQEGRNFDTNKQWSFHQLPGPKHYVYPSRKYSTIDENDDSIGVVEEIDRYNHRPYFADKEQSSNDYLPSRPVYGPPDKPQPVYPTVPPKPTVKNEPPKDPIISYTPPPGFYKNKSKIATSDSYASALEDLKMSKDNMLAKNPYKNPVDSYKPPSSGFSVDVDPHETGDPEIYPPIYPIKPPKEEIVQSSTEKHIFMSTEKPVKLPEYLDYNPHAVYQHDNKEDTMGMDVMTPPTTEKSPVHTKDTIGMDMMTALTTEKMPDSKLPEYIDYDPSSFHHHGHHVKDFPSYLEYIPYEHDDQPHHVYHEVVHAKPTTMAPVSMATPMMQEDERVNKKPYSYYYLGRKLWYIPLYFSLYFIVYIFALIVKSIARHKIEFTNNHDWKSRMSRRLDERSEDNDLFVKNAISQGYNKYAM